MSGVVKTDGLIPLTFAQTFWHRREDPKQPANMQFELTLPGKVVQERLQEAVWEACERHPMTRVRLMGGRRWQPGLAWELVTTEELSQEQVVEAATVGDSVELAAVRNRFFSRFLDIRQPPALRFLVVHLPEGGDRLLLSVNHTICDGTGALRFLESVARAYVGAADPLPALDPLVARTLAGQGRGAGRPARTRKRRRGIATKIRPQATGEDAPCYGFTHLKLGEAESAALDAKRLLGTATLNDLLLAALVRTISDWNGGLGAGATLAVLAPFNLRPAEWRGEVVANFSMAEEIWITSEDLATERSTLEAIVAQTRWLKDGGAGSLLELGPVAQKVIVNVMPVLKHWTRPSAILTNLGRFDAALDFGPAGVVNELWISGGAAMPTGLLIGATALNGQAHFTFCYRHALFDSDAAERFAQLYRRKLYWMGTGRDLPTD